MKKTTIILSMLLLIISGSIIAQVQVDKFTGDVMYGLPLITVPNFRGPSVSTSISYRSDIKVDQPASEIGLGWDINAGGSIERIVNGVPDDWYDVDVPDMQAASFQKHLGALYFGIGLTYSTVLDFDYTRYKMDTLNDTLKYYYPNYDTYYVTGAGMAGKIVPEQYDFPTVSMDTSKVNRWFYNRWYHPTLGWQVDSISIGIKEIETYSLDSAFRYQPHFQYEHNMYGETDSYYYPWDESPITSSTPIHLLGESNDSNSPTFSGDGYNDEDYSVSANTNRARTSNYIEYFTNELIDNKADSLGFMEYDTTFARGTEANFPQDGIGAYRITDPNGYTYHYSLPVYAHYNTSGNVSLDKDYNAIIAEGGIMDITDSTLGYIVENDYTHEIGEIKQIKKYAIRWLLTAITGPDFEDSNSNGVVDLDDAGYWVKYDYGLWTESFAKRYPYYGGSYSFSSSIQEGLWPKFIDDNDSSKVTGKALSYSETANQLYYLNQIQTPSHTGIFCRDLRYDEQSMIANFDKSNYRSTKDLNQITDTIRHWSGSGQFKIIESAYDVDKYLKIYPEDGVDHLTLNFDVSNYNGLHLIILDGDTATGDTLYNFYLGCTCSLPDTIVSTGSEVTIVSHVDSTGYGIYDLEWWSHWDNATGGWPNGRTEATPQLKLAKMFLFDNDDLDSLPSISAIDTVLNDNLWDYDNVNRSTFYNTDWYTANQTTIDTLALQSVDLEQDYSLAKGWHNNRFVYLDIQSKTASPVEVEANKYIDTNNTASSGKLTLNKVIYYGLNRTQTQPSHLFDYNATNAIDNPDYNSMHQDYWGNYKYDTDNDNLLRGYVTDSSSTQTDAWALRTVTSPLGGTTSITYESDEYEQVLSEDKDGDVRGPIKTFALKNVLAVGGDVGGQWTFNLENQFSEFWDWKDNLPTGSTAYTVIPCSWVNSDSSSYINYYYDGIGANYTYGFGISYGEGTLTESGSKVDDLIFYDINLDTISTPPLSPTGHPIWSDSRVDTLIYAGNGFVSLEYPVGEKVKGGGTRVKELAVSNGTDTYTVSYTYDQGTATMEAGDFSKRKTKVDDYDIRYDWVLTSNDYNPFGMSPQVGYGKVTIENKGQTTSGQGKSVFYFTVSDDNKNYFEPYVNDMDTTWEDTGWPCGPTGNKHYISDRFAVEVIDDFTTIWGKIKEQDLLDVNGNTISKKVYEYQTSTKGAQVSTVNYNVPDSRTDACSSTYNTYVVCVHRKYPNYLTKVTTYSNGRKSISEIIDRDIFTGDPIETKNTSINGTISTEQIVLAYTQTSTPNYTTMGAKSVDPSYDNFLNATYSSKMLKASEGLSTIDFSSYGKSFWKDSVKTRYYNTSDDEYATQIGTVNWFDYVKYLWTGDLGDYGMFDSTAFTDITSPPTGTSDWRYISEITLMDEQQNVLEQKGFNDRFSASKLGYDNRFTYTSASNSNYVSFTATGFETETEVESGIDYYEGEVLKQSGNTQIAVDGSVYPHTGNYMVKIPSANTAGPIYKVNYDSTEDIYSLQRGRTYTASVWVHKDSPDSTELYIKIQGDTGATSYSESDTMSIVNSNAVQIGDWIQLTVNIDVPDNFTGATSGDGIQVYVQKGSGDAWIDDMLFHSRVTGSGMNVYDQKTGRVMATLSDNNFATKYIYNDAGQVIEMWKEVLGDTWGKWVKVESRDFNFKRAME